MPDNHKEVFIVIVACALIVFLLSGIMTSIILFYQKKKLTHMEEMIKMKQTYKEELLQSQIEMQEHTFNNISQEIHDNVGQTLSLAKIQLNIIAQGSNENNSLLSDAKDSVSKALADLRDIANSLNSDRVKLLTLSEMIGHELQRINKLGIINTNLKVAGIEGAIPDQKKLILFRIIQESLQNILKHSFAKNIEVIFKYTNLLLQVLIIDDGVGFNQDLLAAKAGLGLQNIKSRALLIGGSASIDSYINKGTTITIILPYV